VQSEVRPEGQERAQEPAQGPLIEV
jgi:hypothetical protein